MMGRKDVGFCSVGCRTQAEERGGQDAKSAAASPAPPTNVVELSKEPLVREEALEEDAALRRASGGR